MRSTPYPTLHGFTFTDASSSPRLPQKKDRDESEAEGEAGAASPNRSVGSEQASTSQLAHNSACSAAAAAGAAAAAHSACPQPAAAAGAALPSPAGMAGPSQGEGVGGAAVGDHRHVRQGNPAGGCVAGGAGIQHCQDGGGGCIVEREIRGWGRSEGNQPTTWRLRGVNLAYVAGRAGWCHASWPFFHADHA